MDLGNISTSGDRRPRSHVLLPRNRRPFVAEELFVLAINSLAMLHQVGIVLLHCLFAPNESNLATIESLLEQVKLFGFIFEYVVDIVGLKDVR